MEAKNAGKQGRIAADAHVYGEPTFWLKLTEVEMARKRRLTVILREKDRSSQIVAPKQWLPLFEPIQVYYLDAASAVGGPGTPFTFDPDDGTTVQIVRRTVTRLGDIVNADLHFQDGSAVVHTAAEVKRYFETEMSPGKIFSPDQIVTIYWIEYLPD